MINVQLTKEEVAALDFVVTSAEGHKATIVKAHVNSPNGWIFEENQALNGMPLDTLIKALYVGYEEKKTPEEYLKFVWERSKLKELTAYGEDGGKAFRSGMMEVIEAFKLEVPGVSDEKE